MSEPNMVFWRALFSGYARLVHGSESGEVFEDMELEDLHKHVCTVIPFCLKFKCLVLGSR
ncbi:hypothetical protein RHMOL_Rhmol03G0056700 [Rhododendron molle]|uniref:Uncharacterized protein n=1 Tax=Rhododendron molle TaxID=49168 RepID=A0ACC0PC29_RHOML|nr:hypothetical protein RHMOL_Rhmol03G0056700 [Rhododendron molle]